VADVAGEQDEGEHSQSQDGVGGDLFEDVPRENPHFSDYNTNVKPLFVGAVCFAAAVLCFAASQSGSNSAGPNSAEPDTAKLERFMRRYYAWPTDTMIVTFSPFKAAVMPGFFETTVNAVPKSGRGERVSSDILVSGDGRFLLENPPVRVGTDPFREIREQIDLRNQPAFGSAVPRVTIVEFGDLQCSYCKQVVGVLRTDIPRDFGREVRVVFKNYPLPAEMHPWAWDAAAAGRCIYKQKNEAFWEFHDWAYEQQGKIGPPEQFRKAAAAFVVAKKLDSSKYAACLADPDTKADIERSSQEGRALHVTGTPAFFINGRKVEGSQSYGAMKAYIVSELEFLNGKP
jgi:protein-disulfide isomerase